MNKKMLSLIGAFALCVSGLANATTHRFYDNFDDGTLNGWQVVYGLWANSGGELVNSYKNINDQYGSIDVVGSFGAYQRVTVDFYWPAFTTYSYTADILLRYQSTGNPIDRSGYIVQVAGLSSANIQMSIGNTVNGWQTLGISSALQLTTNTWHTLSFEASGSGSHVRLKGWLDGVLTLNVLDTTTTPRNEGTLALLAGNNGHTGMRYDNFHAVWSDQPLLENANLGIMPCGVPGTPGGCGLNPAATDHVKNGEATVYDDGTVLVRLGSSAPNKTYWVTAQDWNADGSPKALFAGSGTVCKPGEIASITTNAKGFFSGMLKDPATGKNFKFPPKTAISPINFVFSDANCANTQFTTGIMLP